MPQPAYLLNGGGMDSVSRTNTCQINVISNQVFEHTARISQLHEQVTLLGSQLQRTQMHISAVDARVPSFVTITNVLKRIISKLNEVILNTRVACPEEERIMLDDLKAINMELAMGDLMGQKGAKIAPCCCEWNMLCNECFPM